MEETETVYRLRYWNTSATAAEARSDKNWILGAPPKMSPTPEGSGGAVGEEA